MTELTLPDPTKYIHRFIKRLEKKGIIVGKVKGANYRKAKILRHKTKNAKLVIFNTSGDREIQVEIDMLSASLCPSAYMNNTYHALLESINQFKEKSKEALNVKHKDS